MTPQTPQIPTKIKLTGRMLQFTRLHIQGNDLAKIQDKLEQKFGHTPNSKLPVLLNCDSELDLAALLDSLWGLGLQPIGIITGKLDEQAAALRLAIFPTDGKRIDSMASNPAVNTNATTKVVLAPVGQVNKLSNTDTTLTAELNEPTHPNRFQNDSQNSTQNSTQDNPQNYTTGEPLTSQRDGDLIYQSMLRSGQSINHVGGNLILTHGINAGAEAITDYSLHVYGKAEGRLVAGATGDQNAGIFCLRFNPSLVSVAGTYCLRENIPSEFLGKAVQVSYQVDKGLIFTLMDI